MKKIVLSTFLIMAVVCVLQAQSSTSWDITGNSLPTISAQTYFLGTNNPQAKLAVNGEILAKSVRVNTTNTYWPDYVFGNDYNLMSLRELELYIKTHKHLPGIPSAAEVEEQGDVDLGTMNALLLEKVEELTRYVIDLQNQIETEKRKGVRYEKDDVSIYGNSFPPDRMHERLWVSLFVE
jgi:hypothetical protein